MDGKIDKMVFKTEMMNLSVAELLERLWRLSCENDVLYEENEQLKEKIDRLKNTKRLKSKPIKDYDFCKESQDDLPPGLMD